MKADFQSYAQATSRCLWGLLLQLAMGLALLIYAIYARDHAAMTASAFVLIGVPVWLLLLIVFDQHRRERIEAIESEAMSASDVAGSSVFEEGGDDLRVAARRLQAMHKYLLPVASLAVGVLLIAIGIVRLRVGLGQVDAADFVHPEHRGWALAIGLWLGFLGFVFARYVTGMAKQDVWANLRAGGAYTVGAALVGLLMTVANFVDIAGSDVLLRYLNVIYPVAMIVLGAEVFLNFVLNLYRPRRAGEVPRAAFDSRILAFVAAPDRIAESVGEAINYQFGFNVSSSWFYKLLSRDLPALIAIGLLVGWALTTVAIVEPDQRAMRVRFGALVDADLGPGVYVKLPWPFESIDVPEFVTLDAAGALESRDREVTILREENLGTQPETEGDEQMRPRLWTTEVARDESYMIVQPTSYVQRDGAGATKDLSLLAVEIPIQYAVSDVEAYELLGPPAQRIYMLGVVARREATWYLSTVTVDELLSRRRIEIAGELQRRIERAFAALNPLGEERGPVVEVLSVGIQGVRPPRDVAPAFELVVEAQERARERVALARMEAISTRTEMVGSVELSDELVEALDELDRMKAAGTSDEEITQQELAVHALIEQAGGRAATILAEASAERWERNLEARARLTEYRGLVGSYLAAPAAFMAAYYYDAWAEAIEDARVYLTNGKNLRVIFDAQDQTSTLDVFEGSEGGGE